jgi:signal transduction histidine kinase/predicted small secreted protein
MMNIRKSFSTKLALGILLLAVPIFVFSLGVLYTRSRLIVKREAVNRANSMLSNAMQRLCRNLSTIETATNTNCWLVTQNLDPDSLLALSNRIVHNNPHIDGCSISAEPNVFPKYGKYFSVYSVREGGSITSVVEEQYEYFEKVWYRTPCELGKACWVDFYDEADSLELTLPGLIASYSKPIYDKDDRLIAIISTDLSLQHLNKIVSEEKPYSHSYYMMVDQNGKFFIHPDSTRVFTQTIFSGADPDNQTDIIALGHEMTTGVTGRMNVTIDGEPCVVCYQPVPNTSWSLAIVCPDSDILEGYHRLTYIIIPLLIIGLIAILIICRRSVAHAIHPLNQLLTKTQSIAEGNMEVYIPKSKREDAVGQLQNSFATMLQSLNFHIGSVRYTTEQAKRRNEDLAKATYLVQEADKQKTTFIQNVTHQIRTPLNIIMGFAQILAETNGEGLAEEEKKSIADTLDHNSKLLSRMVLMLYDSSETGLTEELMETNHHDMVSCNDVAKEAIGYTKMHYPNLHINFQSEVNDDFCVWTNRLYLMRSLREVLYNSSKYSDGQHISFRINTTETTVQFIVEDTGKGIAEADRERIFKFFTKVDDLSEGLGLGLPLAKRHAHNLGGDLILDENYHDGCRFIVEIPLS